MRLWKVPAALALGLPASLLAHSLLFGTSHGMGGSLHGIVVTVTVAAVIVLLSAFVVVAWTSSSHTAQGSIFSARLTERLPSVGAIFGSAALFYWLCESLEGPHPEGVPAAFVALLAASWLVLAICRIVAKTLSRVVIAIDQSRFTDREPAWQALLSRPILQKRKPSFRRRFARPPPTTLMHARA